MILFISGLVLGAGLTVGIGFIWFAHEMGKPYYF